MKLPNVELAIVPERKVKLYLLNPSHPVGGSKALFFLQFGFTTTEWLQLANGLLQLARENEVVETEMTKHGRRYVVEERLNAPDGTSLKIRTAWYIDVAGAPPRFVTAHPLPK
ncbi:MAG TPA: hypothetical protein VGN23_12080 [Verrucomicrobiae bacterium]|jgi:hypothetical protein